MKAAVLQELNKPLLIEDLEVPSLDIGQVLVQVHASGICGAQIGEITGAAGPDKYLPHLLGHEGAGVVVEIGPGVKHVQVGDHVVMHWRKGVGIDAEPAKYKRHDGSIVGAGPVHTLCEYAVVSENRVTKCAEITYGADFYASLGCSVTTGFGIINNEAQLKIGQSIAVIGCGGVGLNVIHGASLVSAGTIAAIDISKIRLERTGHYGATEQYKDIMSITRTFDVVVECTGNPKVINEALKLTSPGGKLILVGQPQHGQELSIDNFRQHYKGKTIIDSQGGLTNPTIDIPRYSELSQEVDFVRSHHYRDYFRLKDINKAIIWASNPKSNKCFILMPGCNESHYRIRSNFDDIN